MSRFLPVVVRLIYTLCTPTPVSIPTSGLKESERPLNTLVPVLRRPGVTGVDTLLIIVTGSRWTYRVSRGYTVLKVEVLVGAHRSETGRYLKCQVLRSGLIFYRLRFGVQESGRRDTRFYGETCVERSHLDIEVCSFQEPHETSNRAVLRFVTPVSVFVLPRRTRPSPPVLRDRESEVPFPCLAGSLHVLVGTRPSVPRGLVVPTNERRGFDSPWVSMIV